MGTFLFAKIAGLENNIYLQTGLIMLIGLLAKTAILLTEYAAERRKAGMGLIASAVSAAQSTSSSYPDDGTHHDLRSVPAGGSYGSRC